MTRLYRIFYTQIPNKNKNYFLYIRTESQSESLNGMPSKRFLQIHFQRTVTPNIHLIVVFYQNEPTIAHTLRIDVCPTCCSTVPFSMFWSFYYLLFQWFRRPWFCKTDSKLVKFKQVIKMDVHGWFC